MGYRIAQGLFILAGILFIVAPTHLTGVVGTAATLGFIVGLLIRLVLAVLCFWGAVRMGRKARPWV